MKAAPPLVRAAALFLTFCAAPVRVSAQEDGVAFRRLDLSLGGGIMRVDDPLSRYWRGEPGLFLRAETPLRLGRVSLNLGWHPLETVSRDLTRGVSDLTTGWAAVGWGPAWGEGPVEIGVEGRLGFVQVSVHDLPKNPATTERELHAAGALWLHWTVAGSTGLRAEVEGGRVYTAIPWHPVRLSLSLRQGVGLPESARSWLGQRRDERGDEAKGGPAGPGLGARSPVPEAAPVADTTGDATVVPAPTGRMGGLVADAVGSWEGMSVDRFLYRGSLGWLRPPTDGRWRARLDGVAVPSLLGDPALGYLAHDPATLELRVIDRPDVDPRDGLPVFEGRAAATTRRPAPGVRLRARGRWMNETRDPGPFLFSRDTAPNVEGPGWEYEATAGGGSEEVWVLGSALARRRWTVRPEVDARSPSSYWPGEDPRLEVTGFGLRAGLSGARPLRLSASVSEGGAVEHRTGGVEGEVGALAGGRVGYRLGARWSRWAPDRGRGRDETPAWTEEAVDTELRWDGRNGGTGPALGVAWEGHRGREGEKAIPGPSVVRVRGAWSEGVATRRWALGGMITATPEGTGAGAVLRLRRPAGAWNVGGTVSGLRSAPRSLPTAWSWRAAGLGLLERHGIEVVGAFGETDGWRASVDVEASRALGVGGRLELRAFARLTRSASLSLPRYRWTPGEEALGGRVALAADAGGTVSGAEARLAGRLGRGVTGTVRYRWLEVAEGDEPFREAWSTTPTHRGWARLAWELQPGWTFWGEVELRSAAAWSGLSPVEEASGEVWRRGLPGRAALDVGFRGSVGAGTITADVWLRNALDADVRLHPFGIGEARTLAIALGVGMG